MNLLLIDHSNFAHYLVENFGERTKFDYKHFLNQLETTEELKKIVVGSPVYLTNELKNTFEQLGFEIFLKHSWGEHKEKGVDTEVALRAFKHMSEYHETPGTMTLVSGDWDMQPVLQEAEDKNWQVIIWSWKSTLSKKYLGDDCPSCVVAINYFDDIFSRAFYIKLPGFKARHRIMDPLSFHELNTMFYRYRSKVIEEVSHLPHLENPQLYLDRLGALEQFSQRSEIDAILAEAQTEDQQGSEQTKATNQSPEEEQVTDQADNKGSEDKNQSLISTATTKAMPYWALAGALTLAGGVLLSLYYKKQKN